MRAEKAEKHGRCSTYTGKYAAPLPQLTTNSKPLLPTPPHALAASYSPLLAVRVRFLDHHAVLLVSSACRDTHG